MGAARCDAVPSSVHVTASGRSVSADHRHRRAGLPRWAASHDNGRDRRAHAPRMRPAR